MNWRLEARDLGKPIQIVTVSSGPEEDAAIVAALRLGDPDLSMIQIFHAVDPGDGKRKALAQGLREIAKLNLPKDTIIALMDGDSELSPGTLRRCLAFFKLFPKLGALTTDEIPDVKGSYIFSEWFHLRFAQRHYQMCSLSLSKKILCLTGRFALYRSEPALHPDFAHQLESDMLDDWLWGRFKFLSGDDKTTWYWMLKHTNYNLLYIPDVVVYSIESISGSLPNRMYQNMRRWFGNMLRNGNRALALGPGKLGLFVTLCLIDQRVNMWTSLVSPCLLVIALCRGQLLPAGILLCWMLMSRCLTLTLIFRGRQSELKPIHLPILLLSQWSSALIKIWTQMNLAQQRWFNRGDRKLAAGGSVWVQQVTKTTSQFLLLTQVFTFGVILFSLLGILNPLQDLPELWIAARPTPEASIAYIDATQFGVIADDAKDDSVALQALIDSQPDSNLVQINLPIGQLDLFQPLMLNRSYTRLIGQGIDRTILTAKFANQTTAETAILAIQPPPLSGHPVSLDSGVDLKLQDVHLKGFTLRLNHSESEPDPNGILLKDVSQASLRQIYVERTVHHGIILNSTENVILEYIDLDGLPDQNRLIQINAVDTQVKGSSFS